MSACTARLSAACSVPGSAALSLSMPPMQQPYRLLQPSDTAANCSHFPPVSLPCSLRSCSSSLSSQSNAAGATHRQKCGRSETASFTWHKLSHQFRPSPPSSTVRKRDWRLDSTFYLKPKMFSCYNGVGERQYCQPTNA